MQNSSTQLPQNIRETVATQLTKTSMFPVTADQVSLKMFTKVCHIHNEQYGYVPQEWLEFMDSALLQEEAA